MLPGTAGVLAGSFSACRARRNHVRFSRFFPSRRGEPMSETASEPAGRPGQDEPRAILCPRCGLLQPASPDCAGCGIVFAKLAAPAPKATAAAPPRPQTPVAATPPPQATATETPAPPPAAPARPKPVFRVTRSTEVRHVWPGYWVLLGLAIVGAIVFW